MQEALSWMSKSISVATITASASLCHASDCTNTSVSLIPLNDLGAGLYLNQYVGGLYPGSSNAIPPAHAGVGMARAMNVLPRDAAGALNPTGKYVFLSIGMSNTTQEFGRFMQIAAADPQVNHNQLRIIDGAAGGQSAATWDSPTDPNYNRVRDQVLAAQDLTEAQVQAAWLKVANPGPINGLPSSNADAFTLLAQIGDILRAMKVRYPNLQVVILSSRIYAGYASTGLNPEPFAYESGFGVKWAIQAQIHQHSGGGVNAIAGDLGFDGRTAVAPWIAWGPYLWADGLTPRNDGLIWQCSDVQDDGTHPSPTGRDKVANMLLQHCLNMPQTKVWFRASQDADIDNNGSVNVTDLLAVIADWGACSATLPPCPADISPRGGDGVVNVSDLLKVISEWGTPAP